MAWGSVQLNYYRLAWQDLIEFAFDWNKYTLAPWTMSWDDSCHTHYVIKDRSTGVDLNPSVAFPMQINDRKRVQLRGIVPRKSIPLTLICAAIK